MLVDLQYRSNEDELMDDPMIKKEALQIALSDISRANKLLGGNAITKHAVCRLIKENLKSKEYVILDLGCGDGEMLREIADLFRKKGIQGKFIGVDLNKTSIEYAKNLSETYPEISFEEKNILEIESSSFSCDIIICTLTLHHLEDTQIKKVMKKCVALASMGVVINDLQRSTVAYYLFKLFSFFFIKGDIAKNDGLISIKRGFTKQELIGYAKEINSIRYKINWKWAFRYQWVIETGRL
ncbi:methyltransferase domain-containing protein [Aquimarina sp. AU474]|uniref:methyltransferase domain-containing protein n=1 Tax=Aquimarina sp. AU474 TaxID=2108529 RepID=UPI000D68FBFC|nr:methyltransferase domain-containing protein [Aquimarina sp. AU474]